MRILHIERDLPHVTPNPFKKLLNDLYVLRIGNQLSVYKDRFCVRQRKVNHLTLNGG